MKIKEMKYLLMMILIFTAFIEINAQKSFGEKLNKFDKNAVVMFHRQDIDEMPLWSENNHFVGCNVSGEWIVFDLKKVRFKKFKLGDYKVGILANLNVISPISNDLVLTLKESTNYDMRSIKLHNSKTIEIKSDIFKSQLLINEKLVMTLRGNCHSLSSTLDGKYLAFISELDGLIVMSLEDEFSD